MIANISLSHRLDFLLDRLIQDIDQNPIECLETRTVLVPNGQVRQWLLLEIAKRTGIAMGLKVIEIQQFFPPALNSLEMFCLVYAAVSESSDPTLVSYLQDRGKRRLDLSEQLSRLFFKYGQFDASLFKNPAKGWQGEILRKLFVDGPWRLPVQQKIEPLQQVICFGIDDLPPIYWEFLFSAPALSIYLFSPCVDFWEDLCSDWERKNINRYWKSRGAAKASRETLDTYLRDAPKNLANWGKLGRETLKILDRFPFQTEEHYPPFEPKSLLSQIQFDLLHFQETENPIIDDSIKVILTGSSRLREIEALRDEILRMDVPFHEISVLAPDIEPYIPLIEFLFAKEIPYRISGFDLAPQSSFRQGLLRMLGLSSGRWEAEAVLALFETPSFYRKQDWDHQNLEEYRSWILQADIQWGFDFNHREAVLKQTLGNKSYEDQGSWEKGLDLLLDAVVYCKPMQLNADRLEELIFVLTNLRNVTTQGEKSLAAWADFLEDAAQRFLLVDSEDEADQAAHHAFLDLLGDLRNFSDPRLFPFEVIQHFLTRPCKAKIQSSHLHAVRFSPIEEGALIPAKAVFLIGMDEESFPRIKSSSSLDLLTQKAPDAADLDRYLFLQVLFSAKEFLRISYGHLSASEGKPVGPSLLVQELLSITGKEISVMYRSSPNIENQKTFTWPKFASGVLPEGETIISLSDLRQLARHPWKFFLQKNHRMYLRDELEDSFALQRGMLLRASIGKPADQIFSEAKLPLGIFGKAMQSEVKEKAFDWQSQLEEWNIQPFSLILKENCTSPYWEGLNYVSPPLEFTWDHLLVRVVGEIKQASLKGLVSANEDQIGSTLKIWPEALAAAICFDAPQIWMLRNGKIKNLQNPKESLKRFIEYYFHSLAAPSPLLSDWADALLRKGSLELEKKMEKGTLFEDPVFEWVFAHTELPPAEEICTEWSPFLKDAFKELILLYPARNS